MESISIGNQSFIRMSDTPDALWHEQPQSLNPLESNPLYNPLLLLSDSSIELISSDEITDGGVKLYRFKVDGFPFPSTDRSDWLSADETNAIEEYLSQIHTTLLISQEIYLYVTIITEFHADKSVLTELGDSNRPPIVLDLVTRVQYYDYNKPNVIELPTRNLRLRDTNPLATVDVPPTPTATASSPNPVSK